MTITGESRFNALKRLKALGATLTEQQIADALAISVMSQAEAEAGTATTIRFVTALRLAQAIAALESGAGASTTTTSFDGVLSSADDTIQKALDTLDDILSGAVSIGGALSVSGDMTLTDTDAGSGAGPTLDLYRNSASPLASDALGEVLFTGEDDGGGKQSYGRVATRILDPASSSPDARLELATIVNGTLDRRLNIAQGIWTTGATGTDQGADTINASEIYDDGVQIKPVEVFREGTGSSITANSDHTFAHSLSAEPDTAIVIIQCTTADLNYSIGDRVVLSSLFIDADAAQDVGISVLVDATNVVVTVTDRIDIPDKTSKAISTITLGNWDMYVNAAHFG